MGVTSTWSLVGTHPESNLGHHNDRWMVTYPRGPLVWQGEISAEAALDVVARIKDETQFQASGGRDDDLAYVVDIARRCVDHPVGRSLAAELRQNLAAAIHDAEKLYPALRKCGPDPEGPPRCAHYIEAIREVWEVEDRVNSKIEAAAALAITKPERAAVLYRQAIRLSHLPEAESAYGQFLLQRRNVPLGRRYLATAWGKSREQARANLGIGLALGEANGFLGRTHDALEALEFVIAAEHASDRDRLQAWMIRWVYVGDDREACIRRIIELLQGGTSISFSFEFSLETDYLNQNASETDSRFFEELLRVAHGFTPLVTFVVQNNLEYVSESDENDESVRSV